MIRVYENGNDFYRENRELLEQEPEKTAFFRGNSAVLKATDKSNYV